MVKEIIIDLISKSKTIWNSYTKILELIDYSLFFIKKNWWDKADKKIDFSKVYINLGGGRFIRRHWKVLDYKSKHYNYNNNYIDVSFDFNTLKNNNTLPFENNSVDLFYSSHVIEHLEDETVKRILKECYRTLKYGGGIRITCPDMDKAYEAYKNNNWAFFICYDDKTLSKKFLHYFATPIRNNFSQESINQLFRNKTKIEFFNYFTKKIKFDYNNVGDHISWYNLEKLNRYLKEAGFKKIIHSKEGFSYFKQMRHNSLFSRGRFDAGDPKKSLFIDAIKIK
ncbi:MAG: methyltransferase domain-containing protein [Nanoarchaeota archaeon]|nr:methyltransferase domain-containing protein [Nanoarchaeota archaeon]